MEKNKDKSHLIDQLYDYLEEQIQELIKPDITIRLKVLFSNKLNAIIKWPQMHCKPIRVIFVHDASLPLDICIELLRDKYTTVTTL